MDQRDEALRWPTSAAPRVPLGTNVLPTASVAVVLQNSTQLHLEVHNLSEDLAMCLERAQQCVALFHRVEAKKALVYSDFRIRQVLQSTR